MKFLSSSLENYLHSKNFQSELNNYVEHVDFFKDNLKYLEFGGKAQECLVNVRIFLGAGFQDEEHLGHVLAHRLRLLEFDLPEILGVSLVADEGNQDRATGVPPDLLHPFRDGQEGRPFGYVVDDYHTVGRPVIALGDGTETFLTGRIPYL